MPFQTRNRFESSFLIPLCLGVLIAAGWTQGSSAGASPAILRMQDQAPRLLEPGQPIEQQLAGGQAHSYMIRLAQDQLLRVVVEQKGIDVVVTLFAPDGQKLVDVDSPNGAQGPEPLSIVTKVAGNYRLEVRSLEANAPAGRYEAQVVELRAATITDESRVAAERAFTAAELLRTQMSAASLNEAMRRYEEALSHWRALGDRSGQSHTLIGMGIVSDLLGNKKQAVGYYEDALPLLNAAGDRKGEATALSNLGLIYFSLGEAQKALSLYSQALSLIQTSADRAAALSNIGGLYDSLGEKQKALDNFRQALALDRELGNRGGEAGSLNNIGSVYFSLGEPSQALTYFYQALPLRQGAGDRRGEARTLSNIGAAHHALGEEQQAIERYNQSLSLIRTLGDRGAEVIALSNLGAIYASLNDTQKALSYFDQALPLHRAIGDKRGEAGTLISIGGVYLHMGASEKALDFYGQALLISRKIEDKAREAAAHWGIARAELDRANLSEARMNIEAALDIKENVRAKVANQQLRESYKASQREESDFYIALLMRLQQQQPTNKYDAAALRASEQSRARSLIEILAEARADLRQDIEPSLLDRERSVQYRLNARAERQTRLLSGAHTKEQAEAAAKEIEALIAEYQEVEERIRSANPRYAALMRPQPLDLGEIQQMLDADTLLLEYALGEERSYLWAISTTSLASFILPNRAEIEAAARRFYELVKNDASTEATNKAAVSLRELLLAPAAAQLGKKRLIIVADGALQYVPFAALPVLESGRAAERESGRAGDRGGRKQKDEISPQPVNRDPQSYIPLIAEHEIVSLPSASTLAALRSETMGRAKAAKTVAVLADPVFAPDDNRVKRAKLLAAAKANEIVLSRDMDMAQPLNRSMRDAGASETGSYPVRLINSRREAEAILALAPESERKRAVDFEASRVTALGPELGQYRIVHFATHGLLNSQHPELSGVVLSLVNEQGEARDGFLRLHEIYNLRLPVELVVLSACQTALGKEINGEGLVSLTRGFMYAGAPRVVASLWKVDDKATAELMKMFYQGMLGDQKLRPAEALRAAQLAMWKQRQWQSPYYWAAFTLQGEWK